MPDGGHTRASDILNRRGKGGGKVKGRKPKPLALKLLDGNPGKKPLNLDIPSPDPGIPSCPSFLSGEAKREWRRISKELEIVGLLTLVDRAALAGYCQTYARWRAAEEIIAQEGLVYEYTNKNGSTNIVEHPAVKIARESMMLLKAFCAEFGLTPSARSRINLPKAPEKDPFDEFVSSGGGGRRCERAV